MWTPHVLAIMVTLLGLIGCGGLNRSNDRPAVIFGQTMGTTYSVKLSQLPHGISQESLRGDVQGIVDRIEALMSTYRADSEISRFNEHQACDWFHVSPETLLVVGEALEISQLTAGAFDPTIAPLVRAWGFGNRESQVSIPDSNTISKARELVGHELLQVRKTTGAMRKKNSAVRIDLSAIAKGFCRRPDRRVASGTRYQCIHGRGGRRNPRCW